MKKLLLIILSAVACTSQKKTSLSEQIETLNLLLIEAAKNKSFETLSNLYLEDALLEAEYNPLIEGKEDIKTFYTAIFKRQNIDQYNKETKELFDFGETILEIGHFTKTFLDDDKQEGKYFNVWKLQADGSLKLSSETFGFFHPVDNPKKLRVQSIGDKTAKTKSRNGKEIPLELDAYDAHQDNIVRYRHTPYAVKQYTDDGIYYPFADSAKVGKDELLKHFTSYHSGNVKIDSINVWTYDFENVPGGLLRHGKFYVQWSVGEYSGHTTGSGISYYKRDKNNSLKKHRSTGIHIYEE